MNPHLRGDRKNGFETYTLFANFGGILIHEMGFCRFTNRGDRANISPGKTNLIILCDDLRLVLV